MERLNWPERGPGRCVAKRGAGGHVYSCACAGCSLLPLRIKTKELRMLSTAVVVRGSRRSTAMWMGVVSVSGLSTLLAGFFSL